MGGSPLRGECVCLSGGSSPTLLFAPGQGHVPFACHKVRGKGASLKRHFSSRVAASLGCGVSKCAVHLRLRHVWQLRLLAFPQAGQGLHKVR